MSTVLSDVYFNPSSILTSNSNPQCRSYSRQQSSTVKKSDRQSLPRNQVFGDGIVDSFFISSSSNVASTSLDVQKSTSSPNKRYVSSFKTLVNSTSSKHSQKVNYVNDSVIILKLSKEHTTESTGHSSPLSNKHSPLSMTSSISPTTLSSTLKIEGQKRRLTTNESTLVTPSTIELTAPSNSFQTMAMSTTSHPSSSSNPTLFAYRSAGINTIRQRALAENTTNGLLITTERVKSNYSSSMRPARQPLTAATTTVSSTYVSSQIVQPRNLSQTTKSRVQQDKTTYTKDTFDYPDPFTNCPQEILSKLAQLTKFQMETVEWEKKRRFTKKKSTSTNNLQGKDSP